MPPVLAGSARNPVPPCERSRPRDATRWRFGGRVNRESTLPELATWGRVRDHRLHMLAKTDAVLYPESEMTAEDIRDFGAAHVVIATGSLWRREGLGVLGPGGSFPGALTPDDLFAGADPGHDVVVYDDAQYVMAGALVERFASEGRRVTYVTPQSLVSAWTAFTDEQGLIQARLIALGAMRVWPRCRALARGF